MKATTITRARQRGYIVSAEMLLIATLIVTGLSVGGVALRDTITAEMGGVSRAISQLDNSHATARASNRMPPLPEVTYTPRLQDNPPGLPVF